MSCQAFMEFKCIGTNPVLTLVWTVNDVLVDPYPFHSIKKAWINENKKGMDQPRRH